MKDVSILTKQEETWIWLKHRLELRGLTFGKIARAHKVAKSCFTKAKTHMLPKAERILANYVGLEPWDLWPERYDAAHNPNRISTRYRGHKHFLEHGNKEINGKDPEGDSHETQD